ncbi:energy transducer TonB [Thalassotalea ganghwensis]
MKYLTSLLLLTPLSLQANELELELSKHLRSYKAPIPIERIQPKYPISEARNGRSGSVKMSFVIDKEGSVKNVLVTEATSKAFSKEALRAVKKWKYEPAFEDGKPIERCDNTVQLDFAMASEGKVSQKFKQKYEMIAELIENKQYSLAEEAAKQLTPKLTSEFNYYHMLKAELALAANDKEQALEHFNQVSLSESTIIEEAAISVLSQRFLLEIQQNLFSDAFDSFNQLTKYELAKPYLENYQKLVDKMKDAINSDTLLTIKGVIKENGSWGYQLTRRQFSVVDVKGHIEKLQVRCANMFHEYSFTEQSAWKIPSSWDQCSVYFFGDKKSQFNFVEHPLQS